MFGVSIFFIFGGTFLILLLGSFGLLLFVFGLLVDRFEGFLLCCLPISNGLLLALLDFSVLDLGLFGDMLVLLGMLLGLLYDLLGLDLGVIQVALVMIFLMLQFLIGLLLLILSFSLLFVCFLLSIVSSLLASFGVLLSGGVVGLLGSISRLLGSFVLLFDRLGGSDGGAAAVLAVGIADGLRSAGLLTIARLNFLGLLGLVGHGISLGLEHGVLDASLDVLVVLLDVFVRVLLHSVVPALLELGFDSGDGALVLRHRGGGLSFS